jgi:hypothetical protein
MTRDTAAPAVPFSAVTWNSTDHAAPGLDPKVEILNDELSP